MTDRAKEQSISDVYQVLGLFIREPDLSLSVMSVCRVTRIDGDRAMTAIKALIRLDYVERRQDGLYQLTQNGREAYDGARDYPHLAWSKDWLKEVDTGMGPDGGPTEIENARVPRRELRTTPTGEPPRDPLAVHNVARMISEDLGISYKAAVRGIENGEFFQCEGFQRGPHMARVNARFRFCAGCASRRRRQ